MSAAFVVVGILTSLLSPPRSLPHGSLRGPREKSSVRHQAKLLLALLLQQKNTILPFFYHPFLSVAQWAKLPLEYVNFWSASQLLKNCQKSLKMLFYNIASGVSYIYSLDKWYMNFAPKMKIRMYLCNFDYYWCKNSSIGKGIQIFAHCDDGQKVINSRSDRSSLDDHIMITLHYLCLIGKRKKLGVFLVSG